MSRYGSGILFFITLLLVLLSHSMQRLRDGRRWSVFDPVDVPVLFEVVGPEFSAAYASYEASGLAIREYDISVLWDAIVDSQRETGSPFLLFQDNINGSWSTLVRRHALTALRCR